MLLGMTENQRPKTRSRKKVKREIKIKSINLPTLLVDFLNEALYLSQINKEVYFEANFKKFSNAELEGELMGQKIERFGEDIKAATYHDLGIHQKPKPQRRVEMNKVHRLKDKTWEAVVLFDV